MLSEEHKYRPYVTPKSMAKSSTTCLKPFNIASGKSYSTYHYNVYALLSSFFHVLYSALPQVPLHLSLQQISACVDLWFLISLRVYKVAPKVLFIPKMIAVIANQKQFALPRL